MSLCLSPLVAVNLGFDCGKRVLKFIPNRVDFNLKQLKEKYGEKNVYTLPCGQCEACRRNYADTWSIRCTLEAMQHRYNYFVTLTYDDRHLVASSYKDIKKFIDRLEGKKHLNKVRYFLCEEFGSLTGRKHYHAILFMDNPLTLKDATKINGFYYYHSDEISKAWDFGIHNVAPFEQNCARYVAKYANKDGNIYMSRNLGKSYIKEHLTEIVKDNFKLYGPFGSSNMVDVPGSLMRWFIEDDSNLMITMAAESKREFIKDLAHLAQSYHMRDIGCRHEEVVMNNEKLKVLEHKVKVRANL